MEFVAHDSDDLILAKRPDIFRVPSSEKTTQQGAVFGSAMREFVVNESRGQQALAFAAGHKKSEARRKRLADLAIIAEADGDGRTVLDGRQLGGEVGARDPKHLSRSGCGQRDDDTVEVIGLHAG